jgi:hypothetical protein
MRRQSLLPFLVLVMVMQVMVLSTTHSHGSSISIDHTNMLEKFKSCPAVWIAGTFFYITHEQLYRCKGETENRGTVYQDLENRWTAYAYGIPEQDFDSETEAKSFIEAKIAYWLRPKAAWWKPWKEFEGE